MMNQENSPLQPQVVEPHNPKSTPPTQQPAVNQNAPVDFGPISIQLICPHCQENVRTRVESKIGPKACLCGILSGIVGLCFWAVQSPHCAEYYKAYKHYCPSCNKHLGTYE